MNARELKDKLNANIEAVANHLWPSGKKQSNYIVAGDVSGSPGKSCRICLSGDKAGLYFEGEGGEGGDLIDLWGRCRGIDQKETFRQIREWLNVPAVAIAKTERKTEERYSPPKDIWDSVNREDAVSIYLENERGIPHDIQLIYKIAEKGGSNGPEIIFRTYDEDGLLTFCKFRSVENDEDGKKVLYTSPKCKKTLFGKQAEKSFNHKRILTICEGEVDAMTYAACDIFATSVPFGAKSMKDDGTSPNDEWIAFDWEWIDTFDWVYLSMDMDKEGQKAKEAIAHRIGKDRIKVVNLPLKDANEVFMKMGKAALVKAWKEAKAEDPANFVIGVDIADRIWNRMKEGPREKRGIPILGWVTPEDKALRRRPGEGTIWTGACGHGKSNFLYQVYAWLAVVHNQKCFIGSYEEPVEEILGIMIRHVAGMFIGAGEEEIFRIICERLLKNIIIHDYLGTVKMEDFWKQAYYAVKAYGVTNVLLDSASCTDVNLEDNESCEKFIKQAVEFWKKTGASFDAIFHPRKGMKDTDIPGKNDIKGSGFLADLVHNVVVVYRDVMKGTSMVVVRKQKVGGELPEFKTNYDIPSCRLTYGNERIHPWMPLTKSEPAKKLQQTSYGDQDLPS